MKKFPELLVQSPLIRKLPLKTPAIELLQQMIQVFLKRLSISWIIKFEVMHLKSLILEKSCEAPHGEEKSTDLLDMVGDIIRFLTHFHHQVMDTFLRILKPGMIVVELISKDQP